VEVVSKEASIMRKPNLKQPQNGAKASAPGVPGRPDDPKKPGGGYAEETPVTAPKMPLADNERATAETNPSAVVEVRETRVRALTVVRRRGREPG
jgi:hypothetical protein